MSMNRVQFLPSMSMAKFEKRHRTDDRCEEAVRTWRWPQGFRCPLCSAGNGTEFRIGTLLYLQCAAYQYQCSLIAGHIAELLLHH